MSGKRFTSLSVVKNDGSVEARCQRGSPYLPHTLSVVKNDGSVEAPSPRGSTCRPCHLVRREERRLR